MQPTVLVNGTPLTLASVTPHTTALDWLRNSGLTGAKEGCAEGECGACSVMVARPAVTDGASTEWVAINACLIPAAGLDGQEVVTAEGLGTPDNLHPVQREMADRGGSQCGYCTPGFVCSMAAEYYRPGRSEGADAEHGEDAEHGPNGFDLHALSGNLCRCTGYRPIRDAAYALPDAPAFDDALASRATNPTPAPVHTRLEADGAAYVRPESLDEALALIAERPDALLVAGSTDIGVELNLRGSRPPLLVAIDRLPELRGLDEDDDEIRIGAALTFTEIERRLDGRVPLLAELFPQFASRLIRNGATLGGNLGTGSPIGDAPPALLALDARLVLSSRRGERVVPLSDYFTGYRQTVKQADELIREIRLPLPLAQHTAFHKMAKRRFDDISSVAVGFAVDVVDGIVRQARIGLGGVAATPLRATATEQALVGRPWDTQTVEAAAQVLTGEGTPLDDHRASSRYRAAMLGQSLRKFHAEHAATEGISA
ncbi:MULTISPECIES: xanthine dehydrogenase small subunit [unclassified Knoellia]|uniref:xanthine dehydrogenase small subunit n=1 Tax=Knoellia altitudinis TaxID=3404795 RepID=UPI00360E4AE1